MQTQRKVKLINIFLYYTLEASPDTAVDTLFRIGSFSPSIDPMEKQKNNKQQET